MKLRLKKIPPFATRRGGLKRSQCAGLDLPDTHPLASAEIWCEHWAYQVATSVQPMTRGINRIDLDVFFCRENLSAA
jgi:hypothetical protein